MLFFIFKYIFRLFSYCCLRSSVNGKRPRPLPLSPRPGHGSLHGQGPCSAPRACAGADRAARAQNRRGCAPSRALRFARRPRGPNGVFWKVRGIAGTHSELPLRTAARSFPPLGVQEVAWPWWPSGHTLGTVWLAQQTPRGLGHWLGRMISHGAGAAHGRTEGLRDKQLAGRAPLCSPNTRGSFRTKVRVSPGGPQPAWSTCPAVPPDKKHVISEGTPPPSTPVHVAPSSSHVQPLFYSGFGTAPGHLRH